MSIIGWLKNLLMLSSLGDPLRSMGLEGEGHKLILTVKGFYMEVICDFYMEVSISICSNRRYTLILRAQGSTFPPCA